jgi:hypothetical protein
VLVVMGVPLALISTGTARCGAGLDGRADDAKIGLRLARHHAAGGVAQIGAVKTQANATDHVSDVLLGETRVGASGARVGAVDAVFNAAKKRLAIDGGWVWMRRDDLSNTHVDPFLSSADLEANWTQRRPTISTVSLERSALPHLQRVPFAHERAAAGHLRGASQTQIPVSVCRIPEVGHQATD